MVRLEDLQSGMIIEGLVPGRHATVKNAEWMGTALNLVYVDAAGRPGMQLLMRGNEAQLSIVSDKLPWQFNADPDMMKVISEAVRIRLAYLFDPNIAVHASLIEPLPHQITAVYSEMLKKQPLRFLLADDPGAGKTIMTGLLIKELIIRGDLKRCLIVCPGNLVNQWVEDELLPKFGLEFELLTNERIDTTRSGNPFIDIPLCVARMDKLARDPRLQEMLKASDWDLIVCDEAHKMSATIFGGEVHYTRRYQLGQLLSERARHFLLLTATPHNGKEDEFQQFMRLLDKDRFEGSKRNKEPVDLTGLMRRCIKEELLTFEGKRLFPMREAHTARYQLSTAEQSLYDKVTEYVREGFSRAEQLLNSDRKNAVGFALTILQRRLASSPEAIYQSLKRRRERLEYRLQELRMGTAVNLDDSEIAGDVKEWEDEFYDRPEEEIA
jgi:SNF2 family DNA or RNA helicase